MGKAVYYTVEHGQEDVKPKNGKYFVYDELKAFVNGMIEIVPMPSGKQLVCNEEGKLEGLPKNEMATEIWKKEYPIEKYPNNNDELIVGNVLILDEDLLEK